VPHTEKRYLCFMIHRIFLLLGCNLGDRKGQLDGAIGMIPRMIGTVVKCSSFYESEPWGFVSPDSFLNVAVEVETGLLPDEVLREAKGIEGLLGRKSKIGKRERYASRTMDVDILFYDDLVLHTEELVIPHPLLHLRKFVLIPLNEIAPEFVHPVLHRTVNELLRMIQK